MALLYISAHLLVGPGVARACFDKAIWITINENLSNSDRNNTPSAHAVALVKGEQLVNGILEVCHPPAFPGE